MTHDPLVVGLLSPGEMGTALARQLRARGVRVVTTTAGRSAKTAKRARQAGLEIVAGLDELGRTCDVILSTVQPGAAVDVARELKAHHTSAWRVRTFVDANSIAPTTMREIVDLFAETDVQVVDAAIHGQAGRLAEQATMYLSGPDAEFAAGLFQSCLRVRVLGEIPGQASMMKMSLGGMTKGIVALFLQAGGLAERYESAAAFSEEMRHFYPETTAFLCRSVPTYRQHAFRRSQEVSELAAALADSGIDNGLALEVKRMFQELAECELDADPAGSSSDVLAAFLGQLSRCEYRLTEQPAAV